MIAGARAVDHSSSGADQKVTWPERIIFALAMCSIIILALIVCLTVFSRWLGHPLIPDDVLLVEELMIGVIILPLAYVTARKGHIAVTVFTRKLGSKSIQVLGILGHLVGLIFIIGIFWASWILLGDAWTSQDYYDGDINIPKWIGHGVYVVGLLTLLLRQLVLLCQDVGSLAMVRP